MQSVQSVHSLTLGQHDHHNLPVHSADDATSRQQKMLQQRQLALKRQRDISKSPFCMGVKAQLDTPLDGSPCQNKALGWGNMLKAGMNPGAPTSSNLMRIIVPPKDEYNPIVLKPAAVTNSDPLVDELSLAEAAALVQDMSSVVKPGRSDKTVQSTDSNGKAGEASDIDCETLQGKLWDAMAGNSHYEVCPGFSQKDLTCDEPATPVIGGWSLPQGDTAQQAVATPQRRRITDFWRPWKATTASAAVPEPIVEETRVVVLTSPHDAQERAHTGSTPITRTATPWEPPSSLGQRHRACDLLAVPGMAEEDVEEESLDIPVSCQLERWEALHADEIDDDSVCRDNESVDSGIDQTVTEWKVQDSKSPDSKRRAGLNRFMPSLHAPKFWRSSKQSNLASPASKASSVGPATPSGSAIDLD